MQTSASPHGNTADPSVTGDTTKPCFPEGDSRQQLFNAGSIGTFREIQLNADQIYKQTGILFDLDPKYIKVSSLTPHAPLDPDAYYYSVASKWMSRDPVLQKLEVRASGTGLHAILWLQDPPQFDTDGLRERWTGITQTVQTALPSDPNAPHITASTRPIGSINSRNGATVKLLATGSPVTQEEVLKLYTDMERSPFKTVLRVLSGQEKVTPCPICMLPGSKLSAMDQKGKCYKCGTVELSELLDSVMCTTVEINNKEIDDVK